jgi:predicted dehydrogenase
MTKTSIGIGIVGYKFMGRAHSNAYRKAPHFFDLPRIPELKVACGRDSAGVQDFADRWGWQDTESSWAEMVVRDDIEIVDISSPTNSHVEIAVAAARAGKHILCEKPMALSVDEARRMRDAAREAQVKHIVGFNYRRVPAIQLAKRMIDSGELGEIYHWRGTYLQDWIVDPNFPLTWQLRKETAGFGPHGDLNSHSVDLARYLVGEIASVQCSMASFVRERFLPGDDDLAFSATAGKGKGEVTVEDASFMLVQFANGALGSFEASRFASGRKNYNCFEIYGSKGSVLFNLERLNELQVFSRDDPSGSQGFKTIMVTEAEHPYVSAWWPPGHIIGYEHTFVHQIADFVSAIDGGHDIAPNFDDGLRCMEVLEAAAQAAEEGKRIVVPAGS